MILLVLGILIGPNALGLAETDEAINMLRELGLGMLFLLAGYEIELDELVGRGGRRALVTWLVCLGLALGVIGLAGLTEEIEAELAVAIAVTSTALGTLLPILKDSGLLGTRFGGTLMNHGAYGELGPDRRHGRPAGRARTRWIDVGARRLRRCSRCWCTSPPDSWPRGLGVARTSIRAGAETSGQTQSGSSCCCW